MSEETTSNPAADAAPTQPLPEPVAAVAAPAAPVTDAPAAAIPAEKPAGSLASRWIFALGAAIVLAVVLSATSFGAGVLVGKLGADRGPSAMMQDSQMIAPDSDTGIQRGGYGRGRGNAEADGFPGRRGSMGNSGRMSAPGGQPSAPTQ